MRIYEQQGIQQEIDRNEDENLRLMTYVEHTRRCVSPLLLPLRILVALKLALPHVWQRRTCSVVFIVVSVLVVLDVPSRRSRPPLASCAPSWSPSSPSSSSSLSSLPSSSSLSSSSSAAAVARALRSSSSSTSLLSALSALTALAVLATLVVRALSVPAAAALSAPARPSPPALWLLAPMPPPPPRLRLPFWVRRLPDCCQFDMFQNAKD